MRGRTHLCGSINRKKSIMVKGIKNRVVLVGRVGQTPEIKVFDSGKKMARFSLAINDVYYDEKGERVEQTQWHRIVAWGTLADRIERFAMKGKEMLVDGALSSRSYDDQDGNKRYVTEVLLREILVL